MPDGQEVPKPFYVKDCALTAIATGEHAQNLLELRDKLATCHIGCVYYHFWGGRIRPQFEHPEFHNDFASWAYRSLADHILSERLVTINPTDYKDMEELRHDILNIIEDRLDEKEMVPWTTKDQRFHFVRSKIIVFESPHRIDHPHDLAKAISTLSLSSLFYHLIDATRRTPERIDDFSFWLKGFGDDYAPVIAAIREIDMYYLSLTELKQKLEAIFTQYLKK